MREVVLLDTSIGSMNKGDEIIVDSINRHMHDEFNEDFVIRFPTHTVCFPRIKSYKWGRSNYVRRAEIKMVTGTDLFWTNMLKRPNTLWNVSLWNYGPLAGAVFCGVGVSSKGYSDKMNLYTRTLWKKVLSHDKVHSTRDNKTKELLEGLGLKAINTGCPTMWDFTPEFCASVPTTKAPHAITALSDKKDPASDQALLDLLRKHYDDVYVWMQGHKDHVYFDKLETKGIKVISSEVSEYRKVLSTTDLDYVGPRLHAGIFAMQHKRRGVVLGVDHRASSFSADFNLPYAPRKDIDAIEEWITSEQVMDIKLDFDVINEWKSQFDPKATGSIR